MALGRNGGFSRPAVWGLVVMLLLLVAGATSLFLLRHGLSPPPPPIDGDSGPEAIQKAARLSALLATMLGSILLILIFVVGAYLVIRIGRAITGKDVGGKPTPYVDAWSQYRITDEQIDAATSEAGPDESAEDRPGDEPPPRPPRG